MRTDSLASIERPTGEWRVALAATLAVCAALTLVLFPPVALAADGAAWERASASFAAAVAGKPDAIEAAASQWREISDADPADPTARAYAGATTSMLATTTILPWRKLGHVDDGLALIDKALAQVAAAPDTVSRSGVAAGLEVRFVAANTFLALPAMFNHGPRGARLLDEVAGSAKLATAPLRFQATVWLRAGEQAIKDGRTDDARRWFERAAASGAPQAAAAQERLKSL